MKKQALELLEGLDGVGRLRDFVAIGIFSAGLEGCIHEHTPEEFPRATTRGHFDIWRLRATPLNPNGGMARNLGISQDCYLNNGHGATDYSAVGGIPGMDGKDRKEPPEEIAVFVHGWLASRKGALGRFSVVRYSLEAKGYSHPVVGFSWDTEQTVADWRVGKAVGRWNSPKLARFLREYREKNPDTRIRCISNSLGARPLFGALEVLNDTGHEDTVESATVLGGTVPRSEVSLEGRYGEAVENVLGELHNYWSPNDRTLREYYSILEGQDCIGGYGGKGRLPENYHDHRVGVDDHFSFFFARERLHRRGSRGLRYRTI